MQLNYRQKPTIAPTRMVGVYFFEKFFKNHLTSLNIGVILRIEQREQMEQKKKRIFPGSRV